MSAFMPWRRNPRRDIDEELRFHFDARIAELVAQGLKPDEARARAVAEFGDVDEVRANLKAIDERVAARRNRADVLEGVRYDIRHAARSLWRTPLVSLTIIVTLALGLGVNAAMFSLLDVILFRPPAGVSEPDDVRRLWSLIKFRSGAQFWPGYDYATFAAVERALTGHADVAIYDGPSKVSLGRGEEPPKINVVTATTPMLNPSARMSTAASVRRGISTGVKLMISGRATSVAAMPTAAPASESTRLSAISCVTS